MFPPPATDIVPLLLLLLKNAWAFNYVAIAYKIYKKQKNNSNIIIVPVIWQSFCIIPLIKAKDLIFYKCLIVFVLVYQLF